MPNAGDPGAGGLRRALVGFALIIAAVAGAWLIPGFAWRGLAAMERPGLPPCSGCALGFDRLVMLACGATTIGDVIAFPQESHGA